MKAYAITKYCRNTWPLCLLVLLFTLPSAAQTPTIGTYAGAPLPLPGTQGSAYSVMVFLLAVDPNGGFYLVNSASGPYSTYVIYHASPDGSLQWIAGSLWPGSGGEGVPATTVSFSSVGGLVADASGNLYVSETSSRRIRRIDRDGTVRTVAGGTRPGFSGDGGPAAEAGFDTPTSLAIGPEGNLYVIDQHRVRKIVPSGIISTVAGTGNFGFSGDGGPATAAQLSNPSGLAVDGTGNLYISDTGNARIRKVAADGTITTVAGGGRLADSSSATAVELFRPASVVVDTAGNLWFPEVQSHVVRKVTPQGMISTVAGVAFAPGYGGDGGPATQAKLDTPTSVIVDSAGNLQIADSRNFRVRQVTGDGRITTIAGNGYRSFSGDGGRADHGQLSFPTATALDPEGNLYIADTANGRVRKVSACGDMTTVAGNGIAGFSGDGGLATEARLGALNGSGLALAVDAAGNLYIADAYNFRVRKVTPDGFIDTIAGNNARGSIGDGGPAKAASLFDPSSLAVDLRGNLYIGGGNRVRKVTTDGIITTVAGNGVYTYQAGVGDGGPATAASFAGPSAIAVDASGNLYIADNLNGSIRRVGSDGRISTVAGGGTTSSIADGASATSGRLSAPTSVAVDAVGNLYIAETGPAHRIRKVTPAGVITTLAGTGEFGFTGDGGAAASARIASPGGITLDVNGNLFFAERDTFRIRILNGVTSPQTNFSISNRGSISLKTAGCSPAIGVGYARVQPRPGSTAPAGVAVMQFRQDNVLVSEASVPAASPILRGRIYAEIGGKVNTGVAIVNPNGQTVTVSFSFIGEDGNPKNGSMTLAPNQQMAAFLDQPPFAVATSGRGTFSFTSALPVGVIALRGLTNERGEFLVTTLPVVDLSASPLAAAVAPHFAAGGGWTTEVILTNATDSPITGTVQFVGESGSPATVTVNEQQGSSFGYSIIPRGAGRFKTSGLPESLQVGSVRIVPISGDPPSALAIFSYARDGTTVSEAGVPAVPSGTAFRLYAEAFGDFNHSVEESLETGVAVTNLSNAPARVDFELYLLNGLPSGVSGTLMVPANGQVARFLHQITGFPPVVPRGVLRISSTAPIAVVGLRGRYNERVDFLITTMPVVNEAAAAPVESVIPHVPDGGGYTTQFILFSGSSGQVSSGDLRFFSQLGQSTNPKLR